MFDREIKLLVLVFFLALVCLCRAHTPLLSCPSIVGTSWRPLGLVKTSSVESVFRLRAGSDDDHESDGVGSSDDEEEESGLLDHASDSGGIVGSLVNAAFKTAKRLVRATLAAFDFSEVEDDTSIANHFMLAIRRMWNAAFASSDSPPSRPDESRTSEKKTALSRESAEPSASANVDFGTFLGSSYGVEAGRDVLNEAEPILTGSFQDALRAARSQARLLAILLPAHLPKKRDQGDTSAVESFLSKEVALVARKKARKGATTRSFVLWSAKAKSPEATLAIKRLKTQTTNAKGKKRPIVAIVYPHQAIDSSGRVKLVPRLLAQHHCSPPPDAETMAAWLNALRKRHAKQYNTMQTELKEIELFKERKEGYKESVKTDLESKEREEREAAEQKAKQEAEKKRAEEIRQRRIMLEETLPKEPEKTDRTARTVALRFADGRSAQRRFDADESLETIFGWVDVVFEIEQETVTLTTLNGKLSFTWEDKDTTLEDSGLPKMAGLRVTIAKPDDDGNGETTESD